MERAQLLQARAWGLPPHVDLNPILLKSEVDAKSQVIVRGKVWRNQNARVYFERKTQLFEFVETSDDLLASQCEVIVIEGLGSTAEMNIRDRDIVNWPSFNRNREKPKISG